MAVRKGYKERKIKTVEPVVVITREELDRIIGTVRLLIGKEQQTSPTRLRINQQGEDLQKELLRTRRNMTEWYKIAD